MAAGVQRLAMSHQHPSQPFAAAASSVSASRPPLRRATYVHVSDLTSAYNIDHTKLEQELSRVNAEVSHASVGDIKPGADTVKRTEPLTVTGVDVAVASIADLEGELTAPVAPQKRLQPPRGGFNLCVLVGAINVVVDKRRVDQSRVRLAEVEIGDETGTVSLRARDDQIDVLEEVSVRSGAVVLRNCTIELYQGKHIRLAVTKWGKLTVYPDDVKSTPPPPSKMNSERNFSLIDLSIVASEMVEVSPIDAPAYASSRPPKVSEPSEMSGMTGTIPSGGKPSASKVGQPTYKSQHHQQQSPSSRKGSTKSSERRQSREKGPHAAKPMTLEYGAIKPDSRPSQPSHIVYHAVPAYTGYEPRVDMRQYQYSHHTARQSEAISAQQIMMQQQFEMQQRQLHHLYSHQPHERHHQHRSTYQHQVHQQQPQLLIGTMEGFDTSSYHGDASNPQHRPHHMPGVGSSPLLVPMGIHGTSTIGTASPHEQYPSPTLEGMPQDMMSQRSSGAMSPFPFGRMNPDATSFAPSYSSVTQGAAAAHLQAQTPLPHFPYELPNSSHSGPALYQSQTGQPGMYSRVDMMYPPLPQARMQQEEVSDRSKVNPSTSNPPATADTSPQLSGKENVTSP